MAESTEPIRLLLIVLAVNEELELEKTVHGLQSTCSPELVAGMVLLLAQNATEGCLRTARSLAEAGLPIPTQVVVQPSRDIPGCIKAVLDSRPDATHMMIAFSDYCMESDDLAGLVANAARDRDRIYKFSRALAGGTFKPEYRPGEVRLYLLFCICIRILFWSHITDPVFQVVVSPVQLFQSVRFKFTSMAFGAEWMYALLRRKTPMVEIPVVSLPRIGPIALTRRNNHRLHYLLAAIRTRFAPKKYIWEA